VPLRKRRRTAISKAFQTIDDAMTMILEFFAAVTAGYVYTEGGRRRTRKATATNRPNRLREKA
jgi:hypothetical protein